MVQMEAIGRALRWLRQDGHLKQHEVAEAAGITRPMLSAYERGKVKPTLDTLEQILLALGCDLSDLSAALRVVTTTRKRATEGEGGSPGAPVSMPDAGGGPLASAGPEMEEREAFEALIRAVRRWLQAVRGTALEGSKKL